MLQSILMPAVYAQESNEVVMDLSVPKSDFTNQIKAESSKKQLKTNGNINISEINAMTVTTAPAVTVDSNSDIPSYKFNTSTDSAINMNSKDMIANMLSMGARANLLSESIKADSITNSGSPTGSSQFKVYANNVTGEASSVKFKVWTQDEGRNLLSNSSFNDGSTDGWAINNATDGTSKVVSDGWGGNKALEVKVTSGGDQFQFKSFNHGVNVGGRTFTYSIYIKTEGIQGAGVGISTYWNDSAGNWLPECWTSENKSQRISGTSGWTRVMLTTTAPQGAYYTTLLVYPVDKNGTGKYWISSAMIEEGSQVTPYVNGKNRNILGNSSFNDGTANGWTIYNGTGGTSNVIDNGWQGNKAMEVKVASGGDQFQLAYFNQGLYAVGKTFTYSVYIKTEGIQGQGVIMRSYWQDSAGTVLPESWTSTNNKSQTISGTSDWTRVTVTTTVPPGAYFTSLMVCPVDKNGSGKYWISGAMLESGSSATAYVNGTGVYEQDDAKWYDGIRTGDNNWNSTINIFNHFNETGKYIVEAYAYDDSGNSTYIGNTTVLVDKSLDESVVSSKSVNCSSEIPFNLNLKLKNLKNKAGCTVTITYNPSDIPAVTDLCKLTYKKEKTTGTVAGTGITILKNEPGTIVFSIDKDIPDNKAWSGIVNVIEFKPAVSGQVTLNCKVE
jgi:hypothetical protein